MNQTSSLIDLSEVRTKKVEKPKVTVEQVKEVLIAYKKTMLEAIDMRFEQMQELVKTTGGQVQLMPGAANPAQEIIGRLRFLDAAIKYSSNMIVAGTIIIDHEVNPAFLNQFPKTLGVRQEVMETIVAGVDVPLEKVTNNDQLLISGYTDLVRFHEVLKLVP